MKTKRKKRREEKERNKQEKIVSSSMKITWRNESLLFVDNTDTWSDSNAIFDFFDVKLGKQQSPRYKIKLEYILEFLNLFIYLIAVNVFLFIRNKFNISSNQNVFCFVLFLNWYAAVAYALANIRLVAVNAKSKIKTHTFSISITLIFFIIPIYLCTDEI